MIEDLRQRFNASFKEEHYQAMMAWMEEQYQHKPKFHVAETPIFVPHDVRDRILAACADILEVVVQPDFAERSKAAIPPGEDVPGQTERSLFLQFDFGMCLDENGDITPQLIEAQGFPSLYFFQFLLDKSYRKFYPIPEDYRCRFGGRNEEEYLCGASQGILPHSCHQIGSGNLRELDKTFGSFYPAKTG
ncbi:MAG: hypothetical protein AAF840_09995, partial [Bacteroidota bacterium]